MAAVPSKAILVATERALGRRLARLLRSAGYEVEASESGLEGALPPGALLLLGPAQARDAVLGALPPGAAAVLFGAAEEPDPAALAAEGLWALLGPREGTQLEAEVLAVARCLKGQPLPPLQAHLLWGAPAYCTEVRNLAGREAAVGRVIGLCAEQLRTSRRIADRAGEVVHELLSNAMYGAPVDGRGDPRYAHDRTAPIELPAEDRVVFRYGTDGLRLAVEVVDRFGRLRRAHLLKSLRRSAEGQINRAAGGAGIGLALVLRGSQAVQIDVAPERCTRVTAVLELEPGRPPGDTPRPGRTLIFPTPGSTHRPTSGKTAP